MAILVDYLAIIGVLAHVVAAAAVCVWFAVKRAFRSLVVPL